MPPLPVAPPPLPFFSPNKQRHWKHQDLHISHQNKKRLNINKGRPSCIYPGHVMLCVNQHTRGMTKLNYSTKSIMSTLRQASGTRVSTPSSVCCFVFNRFTKLAPPRVRSFTRRAGLYVWTHIFDSLRVLVPRTHWT
jgi:hypothetical protein